MKAPARRKRSTLSRLRPFWIVGVIVAGCAVFGLASIANQPVFRLKTLDVQGIDRVSRDDVVARAAIDPGANVWLLNKQAIESRIEGIPYVETARLHRTLPADLIIDVTERPAAACVRDRAGAVWTIDRTDRVLQSDCANTTLVRYDLHATHTDRPGSVMHDVELAQLEADNAALETIGRRFHAFAHDRFGQLVATMDGGIDVEFGDDVDLDRKMRLIGPILAQLGPRAISVKSVDLRAPATPVVEYRASCGACTRPN